MAEGRARLAGSQNSRARCPFRTPSMHDLAVRTKHTAYLGLSVLLSRRQPARGSQRSMLSILEMNLTWISELNCYVSCLSIPRTHFCPILLPQWRYWGAKEECGEFRLRPWTGCLSNLKLSTICRAGADKYKYSCLKCRLQFQPH